MNLDAPLFEENSDIEYFQELADGAPVMIWMSGLDMGCFYFNRSWLNYRGRTTEQEFGNGWAEGVHPEDFDRCVQHYTSCFQRRVPFAMSYRLQHHSGEFRWILDRGVPHFAANGQFLGFYGGCAETPADFAVERIVELRNALFYMRDFALQVATKESQSLLNDSEEGSQIIEAKNLLQPRTGARQHAAAELGRLATDMLAYDRIANGACLR